jgi:hypothetical protein
MMSSSKKRGKKGKKGKIDLPYFDGLVPKVSWAKGSQSSHISLRDGVGMTKMRDLGEEVLRLFALGAVKLRTGVCRWTS